MWMVVANCSLFAPQGVQGDLASSRIPRTTRLRTITVGSSAAWSTCGERPGDVDTTPRAATRARAAPIPERPCACPWPTSAPAGIPQIQGPYGDESTTKLVAQVGPCKSMFHRKAGDVPSEPQQHRQSSRAYDGRNRKRRRQPMMYFARHGPTPKAPIRRSRTRTVTPIASWVYEQGTRCRTRVCVSPDTARCGTRIGSTVDTSAGCLISGSGERETGRSPSYQVPSRGGGAPG